MSFQQDTVCHNNKTISVTLTTQYLLPIHNICYVYTRTFVKCKPLKKLQNEFSKLKQMIQ